MIGRIAVLTLLALLAQPVSASLAEDLTPKQAFVSRMQTALRTNDQTWLADHMRYPVRHLAARKTTINSKSSFLKRYSSVFSSELRAAVLAQGLSKLFENWQGIMVGGGSRNIWVRELSDTAGRFEIVTINDSK